MSKAYSPKRRNSSPAVAGSPFGSANKRLFEIAGSGGKRSKYKHEVIYKEVIRYGKTKR